jgi:dihydroxy-acid dehydratase
MSFDHLRTPSRLLDISGESPNCFLECTLNNRILRGNLAPGGAVSKITGKEGLHFKGKCRVFDGEEPFMKAIESGSIKKGEKTVVVLRYLGPQGGPGELYLSDLY